MAARKRRHHHHRQLQRLYSKETVLRRQTLQEDTRLEHHSVQTPSPMAMAAIRLFVMSANPREAKEAVYVVQVLEKSQQLVAAVVVAVPY